MGTNQRREDRAQRSPRPFAPLRVCGCLGRGSQLPALGSASWSPPLSTPLPRPPQDKGTGKGLWTSSQTGHYRPEAPGPVRQTPYSSSISLPAGWAPPSQHLTEPTSLHPRDETKRKLASFLLTPPLRQPSDSSRWPSGNHHQSPMQTRRGQKHYKANGRTPPPSSLKLKGKTDT